MAGRRSTQQTSQQSALPVEDYRHTGATRLNNPPAAIAAEGRTPPAPKLTYAYSPRLDPALRFDPSGAADALPPLLEKARREPLSAEEAALLAEALRRHDPWLEWAGKRETPRFAVDPVALHIHERVSTQAILRAAARQDVSRDLFADPKLTYAQAVRFYQHDMDWANRLILGDSLQVMASLAQRENLAGKVQMIYLDPPYGIRFGSNWQRTIKREEIKDGPAHLSREVETIHAYRDTWHLGVHSYLTYLDQRLTIARSLLSDDGAVFIQIGEDNLHRVRTLVDERFGTDNVIATILVKKKGGQKGSLLESINDYIIFACRDRKAFEPKYQPLYESVAIDDDLVETFRLVELMTGETLTLGQLRLRVPVNHPGREDVTELLAEFPGARLFTSENATAGGVRKNQSLPFDYAGQTFDPGLSKSNCWKHTARDEPGSRSGMRRIAETGRLYVGDQQIRLRRYHGDFGRTELTTWWDGLGGPRDPIYVVQTNNRVIERCMLMATRPGDLVLDPTCGSGTTAFVAEQWGRRWITIDTSRVAIALARQRLLTSCFDFYQLKAPELGPQKGFRNKSVFHITSSVVANCIALDPILDKYAPILDTALANLSRTLGSVPDGLRTTFQSRLVKKQKKAGSRSITEGDRLRWMLPTTDQGFHHWTVPFDTDPDYPSELAAAVVGYRTAWRTRQDEVNAAIIAAAKPEELVDQPEEIPGITRVSGPFTVEAMQPAEISLDEAAHASPIEGLPETLGDTFNADASPTATAEPQNAEAYLDQMLRLLKLDGVRFLDNRVMKFSRLEPLGARSQAIHAEGRWVPQSETDGDPEGDATVAVAFGPQYGPVTAEQVEQLLRAAARRGYDELVIAGFSFDGPAQAIIEDDPNPQVRVHMAHIRPDVNPGMSGLLKDTPAAQLFTVFGKPRSRLEPAGDDEWQVVMEGVDIYDPVSNTIAPCRADKVAAWFIDSDYDGRTFCITQAFFPDKDAWSKLCAALKGVIDEAAFAALSGTVSLPFPRGEHGCVAVKVIDPRGNEVMRLHRLEG
jgi:adenine-specific DNA-methyltransferase